MMGFVLMGACFLIYVVVITLTDKMTKIDDDKYDR